MSLLRSLGKALFVAADVTHPPPMGPRILIYHQVGSGTGLQMEVSAENFIRQLDWLGERRRVMALREALTPAAWKEDTERVVITFDDGYRDTYSTAFPLLRERDLPFTLYLCTEHIETGRPISSRNEAEPLTWGMVEEMLDSGLLTVGAHTHSHADLRQLEPRQIDHELATANAVIEKRLGLVPDHFAYPWGYWSQRAEDVVSKTYASAVLGSPARHVDTDFHPLRIHRYPVQMSDGFTFFKARLRGGFLYEEKLRRRLRGYSGP